MAEGVGFDSATTGACGAEAAAPAGSTWDGASAVTTGAGPSGGAGSDATAATGGSDGGATGAASLDGAAAVSGMAAGVSDATSSPGFSASEAKAGGVLTSTATGFEGACPAAPSASGVTGAVNCDATARPRAAKTPPQTMPPRNPRLKPYPPASLCCAASELFGRLAKPYTDPVTRVNLKSPAVHPDTPYRQKLSTAPADNPASAPQAARSPAAKAAALTHGQPRDRLSRGLHGAADRR